ncbi:MAG: NADP-dependent phosphogluconate dehydrogenase [Acidobacteriota bacterium]
MSELHDIGVVGLGVMGSRLARNLRSRDLAVAGYDLDPEAGRRLESAPEGAITAATSLEDLVSQLERPRRLLLMVNAGRAVDAVLDGLAPHLDEDDIVIDGGNSHFENTEARQARAAEQPWRFVGMGISGGSEGALHGPSMMPGGDVEAWQRLQPVLESIAAKSESGPCVTHCGRGSAGHFVKMVHNGIEYGDMQLIAESVTLLRDGLGLSPEVAAETLERWNEGELQSYLIEITRDILRVADPEKDDGSLLLDVVLDVAGQKGTGRWTVLSAVDRGLPIPTITAAVEARGLSALKELREKADESFGLTRGKLEGIEVDDLQRAMYGAKLASYAQGFMLLREASEDKDYGTNLAEVARIWTAGCIIRAGFLDRIREAFVADPALPCLVLSPQFKQDVLDCLPSWRKVVAAAVNAGVPVPGLSGSLAWLDSLTTARGSAKVIQAQRDYFGSHTFERTDRRGEKIHVDWPTLLPGADS